ncbi:TPA: DUF6011 domain-containing protein [Clostridium sporogenes]
MDRCLICHRKLKDEESKKRGIGPTCWRRVAKVIKEDKERRKASIAQRRGSIGEIPGQINIFEMGEESERK